MLAFFQKSAMLRDPRGAAGDEQRVKAAGRYAMLSEEDSASTAMSPLPTNALRPESTHSQVAQATIESEVERDRRALQSRLHMLQRDLAKV
jgi:hypothetical protein